ncbi:PPE domain-containing protein [Pseudonocardia sp.]|uniref:WXG100 family type VII secretion target n=1 Tax=Pseudonocardia sp. TaxID=60912 RepID=UPI00262BEA54|nr:PPE domain-containing protein [Pseudonocardia sp.]
MSEPTTDSLIVEAEHEDAQPLDSWEGAGAVSSIADMNAAWASDHPDPLHIAFATAGAGLDSLDAVMNPLDGLATAAIGWLIEHVWWLHEPLDALAGDPTQITAQAQTWQQVAEQLGAVASAYRAETAGGVEGWEGDGSAAYGSAVAAFAARLDDTARNAEAIAALLLTTGAGVGTVRSLIRDQIVEFVWLVVQIVFWYGALAFLTVGGSLAAGTVQIVFRALDLASDFARRISRLLDALSAAGGTAGQLADAMRETALRARAAVPHLRGWGDEALDAASVLRVGERIEIGKQLTNASQVQAGWEDADAGTTA